MSDTTFFSMRDQYLFITYRDIIKLNYPIMLYEILKDYYDDLLPYLKLDVIKDYDIYNLERLCVERLDVNPLKYLKRDDCPEEICDVLLQAFEEDLIEMYTNSRLTLFGSKLYMLLSQNFIKEVYIYNENPITQIPYDFSVYFKEYSNKIKFVCGDFNDTVKSLPNRPTTYILNDVNYIQNLIDINYISYTEIIIGELGYNFEITKDLIFRIKNGYEDLMEDKIFKLSICPLVNLEEKHYSCLKKDEND